MRGWVCECCISMGGESILFQFLIAGVFKHLACFFFPSLIIALFELRVLIGNFAASAFTAVVTRNGLTCDLSVLQMWPSLIAKCKEGGADVIETYIFWNGHEPAKGQVP